MPDLGNAYVNIVPKAQGIQSKVENVLGGGAGGAEKAGQSFGKKLLGSLAKAGIAAGVGKLFKDALAAGGDLQQSFGGLETIYGEAADQAKAYAQTAAAAGISANDYAEQAVAFGASLKQAFAGDTTAAVEAANTAIMDMADNAAKMGTPLENIQAAYQGFAKQNYTMLDNLKLGYGGTKTEMERLLKDAEAFSGVHYDIDNLGDVYEAIHVIQGELGLTGVAAGEAETTLTGSMGAVKASWENVMAALTTGQGLDTALANLTTSFSAFGTNVIGMLSALAPQLPDLIMGLAQVVIDNAPTFIASGAELMAQLLVGLLQALPDIIDKLPEICDGIKNAFKGVDWSTLGSDIISGIIKGLDKAVTDLYNWLINMCNAALQKAKDALQIGSPSKLFANEVGRWIPAGMALGIEDNLTPVDRAVQGMVDGSLAAARGSMQPVQAQRSGDADRIIAALRELTLHADVSLEGDARKIFRVVRSENNVRTRATNYNALAAEV